MKHQDFQKIKIKVGKRLPKAENETKTNFKTRTIVIKEQLRMPNNGLPDVEEQSSKTDTKCNYSLKVSVSVMKL